MADGADLSDFDPIAGAVSLAQSAGDGSTVRPYDPTWRDRIGSFLIGDQKPSPERRDFVSGLVGSTGLGETGMSASDMTPAGVALGLQEAAQHHDPVGMALNLAAVLPIGKAVKAADAMAPEVGNAMRGIIAYHGSPHSFDKFDLSKIGTGEGAQAYGHGLYFADNEGVARSYRDNLAAERGWSYGDKTNLTRDEVQNAVNEDYGHKYLDNVSKPGFMADLVMDAKRYGGGRGNRLGPERKALYDELQNKISHSDPGHMYQVRINADPAHFLDWDKPLSEQGAKVQEFFKDVPQAPDIPGQLAYYRAAGRKLQSPETSDAMRQAGIPGIKYLDAGSRGAGEGSRNYVVFNHDLIDILRRYAFGGSIADDAMRIASSVRPGGHDNEL